MLLQSYRDEFDIENLKKFNTPAAPGTVLKKPDKGKECLTPAKQTQYCSGVGKGMHMMQYSRPDTYNAVRDLARHMMSEGKTSVLSALGFLNSGLHLMQTLFIFLT